MNLTLLLLSSRFGVCRLAPDAPIPVWLPQNGFTSVTRTSHELSVIAPEEAIPAGVVAERRWRCFHVEGPLAFGAVGVAAALTTPIAASGVSLLLIATYDTDYVLVEERNLDEVIRVLTAAGSRFKRVA